eukprot:5007124-Karenia_brevis.AAC.1
MPWTAADAEMQLNNSWPDARPSSARLQTAHWEQAGWTGLWQNMVTEPFLELPCVAPAVVGNVHVGEVSGAVSGLQNQTGGPREEQAGDTESPAPAMQDEFLDHDD